MTKILTLEKYLASQGLEKLKNVYLERHLPYFLILGEKFDKGHEFFIIEREKSHECIGRENSVGIVYNSIVTYSYTPSGNIRKTNLNVSSNQRGFFPKKDIYIAPIDFVNDLFYKTNSRFASHKTFRHP